MKIQTMMEKFEARFIFQNDYDFLASLMWKIEPVGGETGISEEMMDLQQVSLIFKWLYI